MTDAYGLFGYPVTHSWSPFIHGMFARQTLQDVSYRLYESPPERFRSDALDFFRAGGRGINVLTDDRTAWSARYYEIGSGRGSVPADRVRRDCNN